MTDALTHVIAWRNGQLERIAPRLAAVAPRLILATLPTPVIAEPELARALGVNSLVVKRDDQSSAIYGGSKVRALEFLLGAAVKHGATGVATLGATGSHHVLATALHGAALGLAVRAVTFPQPHSATVDAHQRRLDALGVERFAAGGYRGVPWALLRARLTPLAGRRPFWIPAGATSPRGVLAATEAVLEMPDALAAVDDVVVAAGSCGTAAGILLGLAIARVPVRVVAVRVVPWVVASGGTIRRLARAALGVLRAGGFDQPVVWPELVVVSKEFGNGYGSPTPASQAACAIVGRLGAFSMETTYTGKAFAHLLTGALGGRRVMFWQTYAGQAPGV